MLACCDCDTEFNNFDIDPFIDLVIANCCTSDCEPCESEFASSDPTAADVTTLLRENTAAERQTALRITVAVAAGSEYAATAAFWSDVLALLTE
ncbi:MAG: hypothetical protein AB7Q17_04620 [Phycisphaerae bacterium]